MDEEQSPVVQLHDQASAVRGVEDEPRVRLLGHTRLTEARQLERDTTSASPGKVHQDVEEQTEVLVRHTTELGIVFPGVVQEYVC